MRSSHLAILLTLTVLTGCKLSDDRPGPPPPIPKLPNYSGMADQIVSWLPAKGTAVTLAYMDLSQVEALQGKHAADEIRSTYPDRMDVYLANASRALYPTKSITVVDRRNMTHFLAEQKLQAADMVPFDPSSRVKLKKIRAVNTYVYWKIVREGDIEEWVLRAVAVETGEVHGGLVHCFRLPEEFKVQPRVGDLTVDSFSGSKSKEQFVLALQGKPSAMVHVGNEIEQDNVSKSHAHDPEVWFVKAGEAGYAEGFYRAGKLYYSPRRYSKNKKVKNWVTARGWFEKATALGHVEAETKLGFMHHHGEGTAVDLKQARVHYLKGAQGGNSTAMNQIGYMLETGKGGDVDLKGAIHWYRQAAENGSGVAAANLGQLYEAGRGVEKNASAAVRWYRKASWAKYGAAMSYLGLMYENGSGVPKNLTKAQSWYLKANKNGCRKSHDHWVRVSAVINARKAEQKRAAAKRLAEIRAATWVVVPHSLKMYSYSYHDNKGAYWIRTLKQGERLHVLATNVSGSGGQHWRILHQGKEGYVRAGLLKMVETKPEPKSPTVKTSDKKGEF